MTTQADQDLDYIMRGGVDYDPENLSDHEEPATPSSLDDDRAAIVRLGTDFHG